jgi:hypothetical protein
MLWKGHRVGLKHLHPSKEADFLFWVTHYPEEQWQTRDCDLGCGSRSPMFFMWVGRNLIRLRATRHNELISSQVTGDLTGGCIEHSRWSIFQSGSVSVLKGWWKSCVGINLSVERSFESLWGDSSENFLMSLEIIRTFLWISIKVNFVFNWLLTRTKYEMWKFWFFWECFCKMMSLPLVCCWKCQSVGKLKSWKLC